MKEENEMNKKKVCHDHSSERKHSTGRRILAFVRHFLAMKAFGYAYALIQAHQYTFRM